MFWNHVESAIAVIADLTAAVAAVAAVIVADDCPAQDAEQTRHCLCL